MRLLYSFHTRETIITMIEYSMSMFTQLLGPPVPRSRPVNRWSPVGKGLISWLSFVVYNCEFVTFPLVSCRRHCVVVLEQDTFILAKYWFNPGRPVLIYLKDSWWDVNNQIKQTSKQNISILGQVWYLIVSFLIFASLLTLTYRLPNVFVHGVELS